jgi:hypothetical protein
MNQHPEVEINTAHIVDVARPTLFYVVTAYRWGQRNAHSYVVGAFTDLDKAQACAVAHVDYRGGKYACEVVEAGAWNEETDNAGRQVFYVESPYYGMAGDAGHFHPADQSKDARPCPKPFTVRELQNRVWELERNVQALSKKWRCRRCSADVVDGRCKCNFSPSPWEPVPAGESSGVMVIDGDHDRDNTPSVSAPAGEPDNQLFTGQHDHDHTSS